MTDRPHLEQARENAQRTYDRRRARSAADTLATIPPNRWDDATRQIVATLATISAPSRIDDLLATFDEQPVGADRRCRRRDHLPMGYHLPTACENLVLVVPVAEQLTPAGQARVAMCRDMCGPPGPILRGDVDHVRGCPYHGCHSATTTIECGVCGYRAPITASVDELDDERERDEQAAADDADAAEPRPEPHPDAR